MDNWKLPLYKIYSDDEDLKCYYIGKSEEALIGSHKFISVLGENNEFIIYIC